MCKGSLMGGSPFAPLKCLSTANNIHLSRAGAPARLDMCHTTRRYSTPTMIQSFSQQFIVHSQALNQSVWRCYNTSTARGMVLIGASLRGESLLGLACILGIQGLLHW